MVDVLISLSKKCNGYNGTTMSSLYDFVHAVPRLYKGDIQVIDNEWRNLDNRSLSHNHDLHKDMDITEFYKKLMDVQDNEGSCKFMFFVFEICT